MVTRVPTHGEGIFRHSPEGRYLHLWREVILTYRQFMRQVASRTDYTGSQFEVLRQLAIVDGRSTVSALARELAIDPAAVTRLVAELTRLGLVERQSDACDRRRRPVVLTEKGRCRMASLHATLHGLESALTEDIGQESIETAMKVLRAMRAAAGSASYDGLRGCGEPQVR